LKPQSLYREHAEQCLLLAETMTGEAARVAMLEAAAMWAQMAEIAERYARFNKPALRDKPSE
jgi:hypothetical protein